VTAGRHLFSMAIVREHSGMRPRHRYLRWGPFMLRLWPPKLRRVGRWWWDR
jgi:hypothetical protein